MYLGSSRSVHRPFPAGPESWAMGMHMRACHLFKSFLSCCLEVRGTGVESTI
jgi:hypothetical protein